MKFLLQETSFSLQFLFSGTSKSSSLLSPPSERSRCYESSEHQSHPGYQSAMNIELSWQNTTQYLAYGTQPLCSRRFQRPYALNHTVSLLFFLVLVFPVPRILPTRKTTMKHFRCRFPLPSVISPDLQLLLPTAPSPSTSRTGAQVKFKCLLCFSGHKVH